MTTIGPLSDLSRTAGRTRTRRYPEVLGVAGEGGLKCSAVLIERRWALTAKHCLPVKALLDGADAKLAKRLPIARVVPHAHPDIDLALVELRTPVTSTVRAWRTAATALPRGFVRFVGYGATDPDGKLGVGVKRFSDATTQGWGCDGARARRLGCKPAHEMVVMTSTSADTCRGDSGGAVYATSNGKEHLVAIVSRGVPLPGRVCGKGGIFTRIDAVRPWIEATVRTGAK